MVQKTIVTTVDDLTGEESDEISTVEFALDGVGYMIDLTDKNAQQLHDALSAYVAAARRIGGRQRGHDRGRQPRSASGTRSSSSGITERLSGLSGSGPSSTVTRSVTVAAYPPASSRRGKTSRRAARPTARRLDPPGNTTRA